MSFYSIYYHLVWAVKYREPRLNDESMATAIRVISHKSKQLRGKLWAINGMPNHIHVAVSIPATLAVSEWVKQVKGMSSYELNRNHFQNVVPFHWQDGYSVHTFGQSALKFVIRYIQNQQVHHAQGTTNLFLERTPDDTKPPAGG